MKRKIVVPIKKTPKIVKDPTKKQIPACIKNFFHHEHIIAPPEAKSFKNVNVTHGR